MNNKNLSIYVLLVLLASMLVFSCTLLDWDDSASTAYTGEDDDDDDDGDDCASGIAAVYDCDLTLVDSDDVDLSEDDALAACEDDDEDAVCAAACGNASDDCDVIETCLEAC